MPVPRDDSSGKGAAARRADLVAPNTNALMWCRHCKQDVPAVAPAADGRVQCARCQQTLDRPAFTQRVSDAGLGLDAKSLKSTDVRRRLEADDLKGRFDEIRRSIRSAQKLASSAPRSFRFDPPESLVEPSRATTEPEKTIPRPAAAEARPRSRFSQWVAWMLALAGAMLLGVGVGLLFWSLTRQMPELWNWGLGATLGGQGLMIVGLIQLLANLWGANREAAGALRGVQQELRRLGRTTETLVGTRNSGAAYFYADLARGASPGLLLANLKSQVDALTAHVAKD